MKNKLKIVISSPMEDYFLHCLGRFQKTDRDKLIKTIDLVTWDPRLSSGRIFVSTEGKWSLLVNRIDWDTMNTQAKIGMMASLMVLVLIEDPAYDQIAADIYGFRKEIQELLTCHANRVIIPASAFSKTGGKVALREKEVEA